MGVTKTQNFTPQQNQMAAWAKEIGSRQSEEFSNIELTENLPETWKK